MSLITIFFENLLIGLSILVGLICFFLALILQKKSYFLPLIIFAYATLIFCFFEKEEKLISAVLFQVALASILHFFLLVTLNAHAKRIKKRKQRQDEGKALLFTLPDKENSFIRERLQTTLLQKEHTEEDFSPLDLQMEYVRKSIQKLKSAKLSPADRLAVENYSRIITAYMSAEKLSAQELCALNDVFSSLLKLSAKYAV